MRASSRDLARAKANGGKFVPLEGKLQNQVCKYLKMQYPGKLYRVDFGAGALLTGRQAKQQEYQQMTNSWPDLFICEPRHNYAGLFIELKKEGTLIYKATGLFRDDHIAAQHAVHELLRARGYYVTFAVGFEKARKVIDGWFDQYKFSDFQPKLK
jgi:hypothetical protein